MKFSQNILGNIYQFITYEVFNFFFYSKLIVNWKKNIHLLGQKFSFIIYAL